jgi:environmental stress-induced protein Ves
MKHIPSSSFATMPWRNGGGVTHEILREGDTAEFDWRISLADVAADGPFSLFPKHNRLLCVISGKGMKLAGEHQTYNAALLKPVAFRGSEKIDGVLQDGPCRDFNLIYDPAKLQASLEVLKAMAAVDVTTRAESQTGIFLVSGTAQSNLSAIRAGDFCLLQAPEERLVLAAGAVALKIELQGI